jgi:hypothetical protein
LGKKLSILKKSFLCEKVFLSSFNTRFIHLFKTSEELHFYTLCGQFLRSFSKQTETGQTRRRGSRQRQGKREGEEEDRDRANEKKGSRQRQGNEKERKQTEKGQTMNRYCKCHKNLP